MVEVVPQNARGQAKGKPRQPIAKSTYSKAPNTTKGSYDMGRLSNSSLQNGLGIINLIRYVAGLNSNVKLDSGYTEMAQAAAFVTYLNGFPNHTPTKPEGLSEALYQMARNGAQSSNLAGGRVTMGDALLEAFMADDAGANLACLGHRRWILSPGMAKTGLGQVNGSHAMYAFDRSRKSTESNVAWPAQNTPIDLFQDYHPWSINTGNTEDISKIKVTLKRASDNATWTFSNNNSSDGYFNVNNEPYGETGCIIFKPNNIRYNVGDTFNVTITGTSKGTIKYKVSFFVLCPDEITLINQATVSTKYKSYEYTGYNRKPSPIVKIGSKKMVLGTDYQINYENNVEVGKATITVFGILKSRGYTTCTFNIVARDISKGTATTKYLTYDYTGRNRQPAMILKVGSRTLVQGTDYTLTYKNNRNIGTATITAKGIGNYKG